MMNEEGKVEIKQITDGTYSASGTLDNISIIKGTLEDLLVNKLEIKVNVNSTSKSILITVEVEGVPTSFSYQITGPNNYSMESKNKITNTHTFDKLNPDTEYTIRVTVKNKAGLIKETTKTLKTQKIENITLDLTPKDAYIQSGNILIKYPNVIEGQVNQYKWCTELEIENDLCDNKDFTTVEENPISIPAQNNTLIARVLNGEGVVTSNQITIDNIDNIPPQITLLSTQRTTNSIIIPYSIEEAHIGEVTCKYSDKENTYTSNGIVGENSCSISNELKDNKTYYYQICVTDLAGNGPVCETGSTNTEEITNPGISITHTPSNASLSTTNGYSKEEVANITFSGTNITNPTYYIKSTMSGTTNENVIGSCTEENNLPKICSSSSTKNIGANTWYKVSGDINITYDKKTNTNETVYAIIYDGVNYSGASTGTLFKIDKTEPVITFETNGNNTLAKIHSSIINIIEEESGIDVLKYKWSTSNTEDASDGTIFNSGDTLTTPDNLTGTYYLCVYASDLVGNSKNTCSNAFILDNVGPTITFEANGNEDYRQNHNSIITVTNDLGGAELDPTSYKYTWSTNNTATPDTEFTSGTSYTTPTNLTGPYYLVATACDVLGNCTTTASNVFNLDNEGPTISTTKSDLTVTITATDTGIGLHETPYSCDEGTTWQSSNVCTFPSIAKYTIKVRDAFENETSKLVSLANSVEAPPSNWSGLYAIVYYDPTINEGCDKSQAKRYGKTGCMKWYAFKSTSTQYTMILDHNTTTSVQFGYDSCGDNCITWPTKLHEKLLDDTSDWKIGARIITLAEISQKIGEYDTTKSSWSIPSYASWLNESYWVSEVKNVSGHTAWYVNGSTVTYKSMTSTSGVRPVITINKSALQ